jgi:hypothetical protein
MVKFMVSVKHADSSAGGYFVEPLTTVLELKERVGDRTDMNAGTFYLVLSSGKQQVRLDDKKTMEDYGIGEDASIRVAISNRKASVEKL